MPWENWYHCMGRTFGTWLPGDPRGWRAMHHRQHIEGDYRDPPPSGVYEGLHGHVRSVMTENAVRLTEAQRAIVCDALVEALLHHGCEVRIICVDAVHFHVLVRFPRTGVRGLSGAHQRKDGLDPVPRYVLGKALSWSSRVVKQHSAQSPGSPDPGDLPKNRGIWAARPKCVPIENEEHFTRVERYIRAHGKKGACVREEKRE